MIENLTTLIVTFAATLGLFVAILFLPAIVELRKPQDAGPRQITNFSAKTPFQNKALSKIEEALKQSSQPICKITYFSRENNELDCLLEE